MNLDRARSSLDGSLVTPRPAGRVVWALLATGFLLAAALGAWRAQKSAAMGAFREQARISLDAALALRREGRNEEARRFLAPLEEAARRAPESAEVDALLGRLCRGLLDDVKAEERIDRALDAAPGYLPAWRERMLLLARRHAREEGGELTALSAEIRRLAAHFPGDPVALGLLAFHEGRFEDARRGLETATARDPSLVEAWETLARARRAETAASLDERGEVEEIYARAIKADRGYLPHRFGRAALRHDRGSRKQDQGLDPLPDYAAAESDLTELVRIAPDSAEALARRGLLRTRRGLHRQQLGQDAKNDFDAAEADFTRSIDVDRRQSSAWRGRGEARWRLGRWADAAADWREALTLDPRLGAGLEERIREALRRVGG